MARIIISILLFCFSLSVSAQMPMFHAHNQQTSTVPLLDVYSSGIKWAYGFKKLSSSYSGNCIKLRVGSNEYDIGFLSSGVIDTNAINTYTGSAIGRISVLYDQSGNGINAVNTDTSRQPVIRYNNSIVYDSSNVAMQLFRPYDNTPCWLRINTNGTTTASYFSILRSTSLYSSGQVVFSQEVNAGYLYLSQSGSGSAPFSGVGTPSTYVNGVSKSISTRGDVYTNLTTPSVSSPIILTALNINNNSWTIYSFAREGAFFLPPYYKVTISVMYYSDKTTDRAAIEANINSNYSIY